MAHKVLSADMAELIRAMKLAQQYKATLMDDQYRRSMLKAAHVLAMDSKNLLDAVDNARKNVTVVAKSDSNSNGASSPDKSLLKEDCSESAVAAATDIANTSTTVCSSEC